MSRRHEPIEEDEPISTEMEAKEDENVELYKTTIRDVRYIINQYGKSHPDEAWETITKLVYNKKLKGL